MATGSPSAYWLAMLPWLQVRSEVRIGDARFVHVDAAHPERSVPALEPVAKDCAQVLRSFRLSGASGIPACTFLLPDGWDPTVYPDDAAQAKLYWAASLLMLSALSANEYGQHNAWCANARTFQLNLVKFTSPPGYLPLTRRRRDRESLTIGAEWGDPLFHIPDECNPPMPVSVDKRLASSLGSLEDDDPLAQRLRLALPFFGWANTLADSSSWEMEIIAFVAALEALLGSNGQYTVAKAVRHLLQPYGSIRVRDARRTRPKITTRGGHAAQQEGWHVHGLLIHELYDIRNGLAHKGFCDTAELAWFPYEHLAMGAFLFPLLVKLLLARRGRYELTWDDKGACDAVDPLLAAPVWFDWRNPAYDGQAADTKWAAILLQETDARHRREGIELAKQVFRRET